jgi:hypothetical protein
VALILSHDLAPDAATRENTDHVARAVAILQNVAFMEGEVDAYSGDLLNKVNMLRSTLQTHASSRTGVSTASASPGDAEAGAHTTQGSAMGYTDGYYHGQ